MNRNKSNNEEPNQTSEKIDFGNETYTIIIKLISRSLFQLIESLRFNDPRILKSSRESLWPVPNG